MIVLLNILGILGLSVACLLVAGWIIPKTFRWKTREIFQAPADKIYSSLLDIGGLSSRQTEIRKIDQIAGDEHQSPRWRVTYAAGRSAHFEITERIPGQLVEVTVTNRSIGMSGKWRYQIEGRQGFTIVTLSEESHTSNILTRSLFLFTGRRSILRKELRNLKRVLGER